MRLACCALLIAACGSSAKPPPAAPEPEQPVRTPQDPPPQTAPPPLAPPAPLEPWPAPTCPGNERVRGHARDARTGEALAGVTIVLAVAGGPPTTAITDENGVYCIDLDGADLVLDAYYAEFTIHREMHVGAKTSVDVDELLFDLAQKSEIIEIDDGPHCGPEDC